MRSISARTTLTLAAAVANRMWGWWNGLCQSCNLISDVPM